MVLAPTSATTFVSSGAAEMENAFHRAAKRTRPFPWMRMAVKKPRSEDGESSSSMSQTTDNECPGPIHSPGFYEINHSFLPLMVPAELYVLRVALVVDVDESKVTIKFPSLDSLKSFLDDNDEKVESLEGRTPEEAIMGSRPEMDVVYGMSTEMAEAALVRRIPCTELLHHGHLKDFWVADENHGHLKEFWMATEGNDADVSDKMEFTSPPTRWAVRRKVLRRGRPDTPDVTDNGPPDVKPVRPEVTKPRSEHRPRPETKPRSDLKARSERPETKPRSDLKVRSERSERPDVKPRTDSKSLRPESRPRSDATRPRSDSRSLHKSRSESKSTRPESRSGSRPESRSESRSRSRPEVKARRPETPEPTEPPPEQPEDDDEEEEEEHEEEPEEEEDEEEEEEEDDEPEETERFVRRGKRTREHPERVIPDTGKRTRGRPETPERRSARVSQHIERLERAEKAAAAEKAKAEKAAADTAGEQDDSKAMVEIEDNDDEKDEKPVVENGEKAIVLGTPKPLKVPREMQGRWSNERYKKSQFRIYDIMKLKGAGPNKMIPRSILREEARHFIGDTGLLDHLLKHMTDVVVCDNKRFRRRHNSDGVMEYWLEDANLLEIRKAAGIEDPTWIPPPGWKPGDKMNEFREGMTRAEAAKMEELAQEVQALKREIKLLSKPPPPAEENSQKFKDVIGLQIESLKANIEELQNAYVQLHVLQQETTGANTACDSNMNDSNNRRQRDILKRLERLERDIPWKFDPTESDKHTVQTQLANIWKAVMALQRTVATLVSAMQMQQEDPWVGFSPAEASA